MPDQPFIGTQLQVDEFRIGEAGQIALERRRLAKCYLVDPPVGAIDLGVIVALARVAPIADVERIVGPLMDGDSPEPGIVGEQKVGGAASAGTGTVKLEAIAIDPITMDVAGKETISIFRRPFIA